MKLSVPVYQLKRAAKALARQQQIPLYQALDQIAQREGFRHWNLLAARHAQTDPAGKVLSRLRPGDLVLVGARPQQGKTLFSLELAVAAMRSGGQAHFFSLEYIERDIAERFSALGEDPQTHQERFHFDGSDEICADYIVTATASAAPGTLVVVDYLQLLDQNRNHPPLEQQMQTLKSWVRSKGLILVMISQIDRTFPARDEEVPGLADVRLPNPLDLGLFDQALFLNGGELQLSAVN